MNSIIVEYKELLSDYEEGLYSNIEIVSKTLALLGEGNYEVWESAPDWVREKVKEKVSSVTGEDEFVSFSGRSSGEIKNQLIELRKWLVTQGILKTSN